MFIRVSIYPLLFLGALITFLGITFKANASCTAVMNREIQQIIDRIRWQHQVVGIEVSLSCPGENYPRDFVSGSIASDGYSPLKPEHLFQIGSETKSFIAAMMLQLEEQGFLDIDKPISHWLSALIPDWQNITIRQLLNHTSGIPSYTEMDEFWWLERESDFLKSWSSIDLLHLVENRPLDFPSGKGWHYSDTNYILAGMIIASVTEHSVEKELKSRLFQPLHLEHTYYLLSSPPDYLLAKMAHGYELRDDNSPFDATYVNLSMADAAGAILSTAHDTAIWFRELLTTNKVLSAKQRKKLMTLVDSNGQPTFGPGSGLGIFLDYNQFGEEVWSHMGGTPGYLSSMLWLKSQNIVITILINSNNNQASVELWNDLVSYIHYAST